MATATKVPLASFTLSSAVYGVTFDSISQSYTDLMIVMNLRDTSSNTGNTDVYMNFNNDFGSNYSNTQIYGNGTSAVSNRLSSQRYAYAASMVPGGTDSGTFNTSVINIMSYSNTTTYKTLLTRTGLANSLTAARVNLYQSTSAISTITITCETATTFASGCTFSLYGIL